MTTPTTQRVDRPVIEDVAESLGMWAVLFAGLDPNDQAWVLDCLDRYKDCAPTARL